MLSDMAPRNANDQFHQRDRAQHAFRRRHESEPDLAGTIADPLRSACAALHTFGATSRRAATPDHESGDVLPTNMWCWRRPRPSHGSIGWSRYYERLSKLIVRAHLAIRGSESQLGVQSSRQRRRKADPSCSKFNLLERVPRVRWTRRVRVVQSPIHGHHQQPADHGRQSGHRCRRHLW
jgi:hypothetical protein